MDSIIGWICPVLAALGYSLLFVAMRQPDFNFKHHWGEDRNDTHS